MAPSNIDAANCITYPERPTLYAPFFSSEYGTKFGFNERAEGNPKIFRNRYLHGDMNPKYDTNSSFRNGSKSEPFFQQNYRTDNGRYGQMRDLYTSNAEFDQYRRLHLEPTIQLEQASPREATKPIRGVDCSTDWRVCIGDHSRSAFPIGRLQNGDISTTASLRYGTKSIEDVSTNGLPPAFPDANEGCSWLPRANLVNQAVDPCAIPKPISQDDGKKRIFARTRYVKTLEHNQRLGDGPACLSTLHRPQTTKDHSRLATLRRDACRTQCFSSQGRPAAGVKVIPQASTWFEDPRSKYQVLRRPPGRAPNCIDPENVDVRTLKFRKSTFDTFCPLKYEE